MKVQVNAEKSAVAIDLEAAVPMAPHYRVPVTPQVAIDLARDLIDAVTQCGFEVKMTVEVPRTPPTQDQINRAVIRVGHLRRDIEHKAPWHDTKANTELVMRVLEACS